MIYKVIFAKNTILKTNTKQHIYIENTNFQIPMNVR